VDFPEVGRGALSSENEPDYVIIAGDWHGNWRWGSSQLHAMRSMLPEPDPLIVLHLGDWGVWPGSEFTERMGWLAKELHMKIFVTPGNHEDYTQIKSRRYWSADGIRSARPVTVLDRGTRWQWHGRTWLSVGGAASADQRRRLLGLSWWPEEELTDEEVTQITADGPADVLLTHDVGSAVPLDLGPWPADWGEEARAKCLAHREREQRLADGVKPSHWWHGHYHQYKRHDIEMSHDIVRVTGLSLDGASGNWAIVNARTMQLEYVNNQEK
jgi:Calcineurin-like phosphoesterase